MNLLVRSNLINNINELPEDISNIIYKYTHQLNMQDTFDEIKQCVEEIHKVWEFMKYIYLLCCIDFINNHIDEIIICNEPYYVNDNTILFYNLNILQNILLNGYYLFEEYVEMQLRLLFSTVEFGSTSMPLFPGLFLELNINTNDLLSWTPLYHKYKNSTYLKNLLSYSFHTNVILQCENIQEGLLELYEG